MGIRLGVAFGDPIPPDKIMDALNAPHRPEQALGIAENSTQHNWPSGRPGLNSALPLRGWMGGATIQVGGKFVVGHDGPRVHTQMDGIRSEVTDVIQRAVEELGRKVSGVKLNLPLSCQNGSQCRIR